MRTKSSTRFGLLCCLLLGVCHPGRAGADSSVIDKIYHPYVQPLERELEFRASIEDNSDAPAGDRRKYRLGYGQSLNDHWFGELYLIGEKNADQAFRLDAYELEALWQITEQGEYSADWGLLIELEKLRTDDIMEFSTALLVEKEWRRWTGTMNLYAIYEFGSDIKNELESALALQTRYRYSRALEPAVEVYMGENTRGLGPVLMGSKPFGGARRLHWEGGVIFGLDEDTPDRTFRVLLEYEF
ncbi:MAG: hypothetical protein PVJ66_09480 [Gammaproteobacteria bacterium]|jgi:hypothetical protein